MARKLRYWYGKGRDGKWYWHGVKNKRITCDGGQGYATKRGCYTAMCKHIEDNENGNYEIAYGHVPEWSILDALRQYEALRESNHVSR